MKQKEVVFTGAMETISNRKVIENCNRLSKIAFDPAIDCKNVYRCIRLSRYGRFGNQFWTVVRGLKMAEAFGFKIVRIDKGKAFINQSLRWHGIDLIVEDPYNPPEIPCYELNSYWAMEGFKYLNLTVEDDILDLFTQFIPVREFPTDVLLMYMRSGDIFTRNPPAEYAQPFCNFYLDAMRHRSWSKVLLYAQDHKNPCVDLAIANGAVEQNTSSFADVIRDMAGARNIVTPRGTLAPTFIALARNLKNLYTFNMSTAQFKAQEHLNCVPTDTFYREVMAKWKMSNKQLEYMKETKCLKWENLPYNPAEDRKIFVHEAAI